MKLDVLIRRARCSRWPRLRCAQVAEWLMAADCKSAAPCELRRFESSPVHQHLTGEDVKRERKLWVALGIYVVLGALAWLTLDDRKIRLAALLILAFFVVRTLVQDRRAALEAREGQQQPERRE